MIKKNVNIDKSIAQIDSMFPSELKKYFVHSKLDYDWGMIISDVGHVNVAPNRNYPPEEHPTSHMFSWNRGRTLNGYQLLIVTHGEGVLESEYDDTVALNKGDAFILLPGEWHRYKPKINIGWTEIWLGFRGEIADIIMKDYVTKKRKTIIKNCLNMSIINLFTAVFQLATEQPFGYQKTASSICMQIVAEIQNTQHKNDRPIFDNSIISKAKHLMQKKIENTFDLSSFCKLNRVSYSKFRSDFKNQTGLAPMQYYILLKIEKAKFLLINTDLKAKEIAFQIGFSSEHYFCRLFKKKTGFSTKEFKLNSCLKSSNT